VNICISVLPYTSVQWSEMLKGSVVIILVEEIITLLQYQGVGLLMVHANI